MRCGARFEASADAERQVAIAAEAADRALERFDDAAHRLADAEAAVSDARASLATELAAWAGAHQTVVEPGDVEAVLGAVEEFGDGDRAGHRSEVWRDRLDPRRAAGTRERDRLDAALAERRDQARGLEERRQAILDERDDAPPAVPWRGAGRDERVGAPLWRLVRFADGVDPARAADVEAALEAAGLLDAWVAPDGSVGRGDHDAFVQAEPERAEPGWLAELLVAEDDAPVPPAVIDRVITAVSNAVGADGRYQVGPLGGAHTVPVARYIGATARAAHRAARVAALDAELAELDVEVAALAEQVSAVDAWLLAADSATTELPRVAALAGCLRVQEHAAVEHTHARAALDDATATAEAARRVANDRRAALRREAQARSVLATAEGITATSAALARFREDGAELAAAADLAAIRVQAVTRAERRGAEAADRRTGAHEELVDRRREHQMRGVELATLRDRMGVDIATVLAELAEVDAAIATGDNDLRRLATALKEAAVRHGQAERDVAAAQEALAAAEQGAAEAGRRLAVLRRPDLAGPLELAVPADAAAAILDAVDAAALGVSASDERRKAAKTRVINGLEELQRTLGSGYRPAWDVDDDVIVVTVADDLGVRSMDAFAGGLRTQRAEQEVLLTAKERAVFEDTLLASVCTQIHSRIQATRDLVRVDGLRDAGPKDVVGPDGRGGVAGRRRGLSRLEDSAPAPRPGSGAFRSRPAGVAASALCRRDQGRPGRRPRCPLPRAARPGARLPDVAAVRAVAGGGRRPRGAAHQGPPRPAIGWREGGLAAPAAVRCRPRRLRRCPPHLPAAARPRRGLRRH